MLARLDPLLRDPVRLTAVEIGVLDARAYPSRLSRLIPRELPSEIAGLVFEGGSP